MTRIHSSILVVFYKKNVIKIESVKNPIAKTTKTEFINTLYQKKESLKINTDNNLEFDNSDVIIDDDIVL